MGSCSPSKASLKRCFSSYFPFCLCYSFSFRRRYIDTSPWSFASCSIIHWSYSAFILWTSPYSIWKSIPRWIMAYIIKGYTTKTSNWTNDVVILPFCRVFYFSSMKNRAWYSSLKLIFSPSSERRYSKSFFFG